MCLIKLYMVIESKLFVSQLVFCYLSYQRHRLNGSTASKIECILLLRMVGGWMLSRCHSKFLFVVLGIEYHAHFRFSDSDK